MSEAALKVSCAHALRVADSLERGDWPADEVVKQACIELARAYREVTLEKGESDVVSRSEG